MFVTFDFEFSDYSRQNGQLHFREIHNDCLTRMPVKRPTWQPALGIRKPDNIISSDYVNRKIFMPSYDSDCRVSMDQLITNEYQRIWWRERNAWNDLVAKPNARNEILLRKAIPRKKQSPSSKDNTKLFPSKSHQKNKTIIDDQKNDPNRQN